MPSGFCTGSLCLRNGEMEKEEEEKAE